MSRVLAGRRRIVRTLALIVGLATATHLLAVWAVPRLIMSRLLETVEKAETDGVLLPPMTDASQRRVVMPSPDLLYALCRIDLGDRALRIRIDPGQVALWSLALYAANSDNYFAINDQRWRGEAVDLVLLPPGLRASQLAIPPGALTVSAPSARGLLLVRLLASDYEQERDALERARQSLRCEPL